MSIGEWCHSQAKSIKLSKSFWEPRPRKTGFLPNCNLLQKGKSRTVVPSKKPANNRHSPSKGPNLVLEEKLEFLKDLHEKNLIDEKEYNQKRKELLDTYL